MSDLPLFVFKIQFNIQNSHEETTTSQLKEIFGEPIQYSHSVSAYNKIRTQIRIIPVETENQNIYDLYSYGDYKRVEGFPKIFHQSFENSRVFGNIPKIINILGDSPTVSWKEQGLLFSFDNIFIKIFSISKEDGDLIDSQHKGVIIESIMSYGDHTNQICRNMKEIAEKYFVNPDYYIPSEIL